MPDPIGVPQTLQEGVRRPLTVLGIAVVFLLGGIWMIRTSASGGWLVAVLGGLGTVIMGVIVVQGGRRLRLDRTGMEIGSGFRRKGFVAWHDITGFRVKRVGRRQYVSYGLREGGAFSQTRTLRLNRKMGLPDAMLPTLYEGMTPDELAGYLEEWRVAAGVTASSGRPPG